MSDINGTGMASTPINEPSGAVTSREATPKKPSQGKFKSGINKPAVKIDTNKHGIRRETPIGGNQKKTGRKKV